MEIWLVDLGRSGAALEACEATRPRLSDQDVHRLNEIGDRASRQQRRALAISLRLLLARVAGDGRFDRVAFSHEPFGKPVLPPALMSQGEFVFSLSHAQDRGLIAVAREGPIGVDIEGARQLHMSPARRQALVNAAAGIAVDAVVADAPTGDATLGDAIGDGNVLRAWVCLEAYAKALGCGIGHLLTELGVLAPSVAARRAASSATVARPQPAGMSVRRLALAGVDGDRGSWFAAVAAPAVVLGGMAPVGVFPQTEAGLAALLAAKA